MNSKTSDAVHHTVFRGQVTPSVKMTLVGLWVSVYLPELSRATTATVKQMACLHSVVTVSILLYQVSFTSQTALC